MIQQNNVVSVQYVVAYAGSRTDVLETEILSISVHAASGGMHDWAETEASDNSDIIEESLQEDGLPPGVYSVLGLFRLTAGKDEDTPNGPGDYWSEFEPVGSLYVSRIAREDFDVDDECPYSQEQMDVLFAPIQTPVTLGRILKNIAKQQGDKS